MAKIPFTVSARTAKLIGQENFATAEGAIVELVKNGYDADAENCIIIFKNHDQYAHQPVLYIIDNGVGMTQDVIKNQWMKIGTDGKLKNFRSEKERVKTGAKGIGRFALDRLAHESEMNTISKKPIEKSTWKVKWSDFEKLGIAIDEVKADLDYNDNLDLKSILLHEFEQFKQIKEVINEVNFQSGTILKVSPLKDSWEESSIKSLFDNLEVLIPPKEQPEFAVHLFSTDQPDEFGQVNSAYYDDFDYRVSAKYLPEEEHSIEFEVTRNELDVDRLEESYKEVFEYESMKKFPYQLENFKKKTFCFKQKLIDISGFSEVDEELVNKIGAFDFTFYFLKKTLGKKADTKRFPYKSISTANRKSWLDKFGGVKIFRDDFRVRPYGEDGQDWLDLGKRESASPGGPGQKIGGYKIGPDQIAGTVSISRIANASFQDKSGREGIQENDAFDLFKVILTEIIAVFERDRNVVMYNLDQLDKKRNKDEAEKRKAQEEADIILQEEEEKQKKKGQSGNQRKSEQQGSDSDEKRGSTERERLFARTTKMFEQEIEERDEEIRFLRGLASVGLIISSFAHELKSLRTRLSPRTDFLINELKKHITHEQLKSVDKQENPFFMIQLMKEEDLKLKHWLDYSLSTLKRDKRKRTNINIGEYFEKFQNIWNNAIKQRKVKIIQKGSKDTMNVIRAFEVDLDAIFNNLLSNSLTALKGIKSKQVTIEWKAVKDSVEIVFKDNGSGLAPEYQSDPDKIFEYSESSKRDKKGEKIGTGMGLYIARLVINDYNDADLKLMKVKEGFAMKIILPKRKAHTEND